MRESAAAASGFRGKPFVACLLAASLLAGCGGSGPQPSPRDTPDPVDDSTVWVPGEDGAVVDMQDEVLAPSRLTCDLSRVSPGDWVEYELRVGEFPRRRRLACVGAEGEFLWLEESVSSSAGVVVVAYLVNRSGSVQEAYQGEPGELGVRARLVPLGRIDPASVPSSFLIEPAERTELISALGREFECVRLEIRSDSETQPHLLTLWVNRDISFGLVHEGQTWGGTVRSESREELAVLVGIGTDAEPQLRIP